MTTMYVAFYASSDKYNFDLSDLILEEKINEYKISYIKNIKSAT